MDRDKVRELQLQYFASKGKLLEVRSLVNEGVNINVKTYDGKTPMMLAAQSCHASVVELLIRSGADISCCDVEKLTVLHYAAKNNWINVAQLLVSKNLDLDLKTFIGETAIMLAAQFGNYHVVKLLVDSGANVNCLDDNNWSVLHYAAVKGCKHIVEVLVDKGVHINATDACGHTPLHLSISFYADIETVCYLLNAGADCNLRDNKGVSSFSLLIDKQIVGAIRLCIEKGAFFTASDYDLVWKEPLLKNCILNRKKCCSQAIINKFNNKDIPDFYKVLGSSSKHPNIDKLMIQNNSEIAKEIDKAVVQDIEKKGFCNVLEARPLVLSMLGLESFLASARTKANARVSLNQNQKNPSGSRSGLKRLFHCEQECPAKRICLQTSMGLFDSLLNFLINQ